MSICSSLGCFTQLLGVCLQLVLSATHWLFMCVRSQSRSPASQHEPPLQVDTSNEIGGDGDVPHPAIGGARRMQVPDPSQQHRVMVEAVENHM